MKKRIIGVLLILVGLASACTPAVEKNTYICKDPQDPKALKLTIKTEDDVVYETNQLTIIDLTSFSKQEKLGLKKTIKSGDFQKDLKQVHGVKVQAVVKKSSIEVQVLIDFSKVDLKDLYDLQLINLYNSGDNELLIKEYIEYQEEYYKLSCKEVD